MKLDDETGRGYLRICKEYIPEWIKEIATDFEMDENGKIKFKFEAKLETGGKIMGVVTNE